MIQHMNESPSQEHESAAGPRAVTTQKLFEDLRTVIEDGQELIRAGLGDLTHRSREARNRLLHAMENAKVSCQKLEHRARESVQAVDEKVRTHPYEAVGIACCLGILFGVLVNREGRRTRGYEAD
jgi:ElaB/YqjD/DUF883 family membrane-anchored ribosome-binding protein